MKVLWFSVTPSLFHSYSNSHNGGGWIASLERIVRQVQEVELGIAFNFAAEGFVYEQDGVKYYPISHESLETYKQIIDDFKPDLIQIFGSENDFGRICDTTEVPVVIHMQGCLPPYHNALLPVGMSKTDFILQKGLSLRYRYIGLRSESAFRKRAKRELQTIGKCRYFMGRTDWDHRLIDLFNPSATYFHCEEALRQSFIDGEEVWTGNEDGTKRVVSIISRPWYKGCDLILKTANLLTKYTDIDFEWQVYGIPEMHFYEHKYGINASNVHIKVMGTATEEELLKALCGSSCYVHSSYIDNSPNSLCEAQILGVPVLATHVGGISSLVKDGESGILFPANDPYTLASLIKQLCQDKEKADTLSKGARKQALLRHDPERIKQRLIQIYRHIIHENNT